MKNIRNIIEQKYPPENPNDLWMKDNVLYKSTHKGWTPLTAGGGSSTNGVTSTTWQELKDKRDTGKLTPGALYRITDYNCTTTQENTQSAGHQFDIVLLALSENKLAEEGWAMEHPTDVYDVTFSDGVTKKCYLYDTDADYCNLVLVDSLLGCSEIEKQGQLAIDNINKTISTDTYSLSDLNEENLPYNYFQNSNLSAWKVWYCLDNDTARFAWADDSVDEDSPASITSISRKGEIYTLYRDSADDLNNLFAWKEGVGMQVYTASQTPSVGDTIYDGNGVSIELTVSSFTPAHEGQSKLPSVECIIDGERVVFILDKGDFTPNKRKWVNPNDTTTIYTDSITPKAGDKTYTAVTVMKPFPHQDFSENSFGVDKFNPPVLVYKGRGVIYRLIDEWNNDVPYDFKNIQYVTLNITYYAFMDGGDYSDYSLTGNVKDNRCFLNVETPFMPYYVSSENNMCVSNIFLGAYLKNLVVGDTFCNIYKNGTLITHS